MKQLDQLTPNQLTILVNILHHYKIQEKAYYELLGVSFTKISHSFVMKDRVDIIYKLTIPKIDDAVMFNISQETLREFMSMLLHNEGLNQEGDMDNLQLQLEGFFNPKQLLYLEEQYSKNHKEVQKSENLLVELNKENSHQAARHLQIETMSYIKILW